MCSSWFVLVDVTVLSHFVIRITKILCVFKVTTSQRSQRSTWKLNPLLRTDLKRLKTDRHSYWSTQFDSFITHIYCFKVYNNEETVKRFLFSLKWKTREINKTFLFYYKTVRNTNHWKMTACSGKIYFNFIMKLQNV